MNNAQLLADLIEGSRIWTLKLIADLSGDDWFYQPTQGMAHSLWLCGHLAASENVLIHDRCLGNPILDTSFLAHFPIGGLVKSAQEHDYPPITDVLDVMADLHVKTLTAIRGMHDETLAEPCTGAEGKPHPHYKDIAGAICHCARHEGFHAGQIASIRRLLGKSFLR